jgi:alcohol dehydrogenase class IV
MGCSSEYIRPAFSVVDPELTMGLPPEITRNAGYDALMHAVESFAALDHNRVAERPILYQGSNPFSRGIALEAFRLIWRSYRKSVANGQDRKAREDMSLGSHLAGLAFSHSGLGLVHALASSLGGMIAAPHGVCLAASTHIGLGYNSRVCERDFSLLADAMKTGRGSGSAKRFMAEIQDLIRELGLPEKPSELGIKREDARAILEKTLIQKRRLPTNPRLVDNELLSLIEEGI